MDKRGRWLALIGASLAALTTSRRVAMSDTLATLYPAWNLLHHGTMKIARVHNSNIGDEIHHGISDRMPGMIWALVPFSFTPRPDVASFIIAAFIVNGLTLWAIGSRWGFQAALLATIASPLVYVNKAFWPQSIDILLLVLAANIVTKYWQRKPYWLVPIAIGITITRPPTFALLLGLVFILSTIRWFDVLLTMIGGAIGAVILLVFSHHYFGIWSLRGGYGIVALKHESFWHTLEVGILSPQRGILFYTPWLIFAIIGVSKRWRMVALLAFLYVLAEWKVYTAFGGDGYLGYRYALPFTVLAIPAAIQGMRRAKPLAVALLSWSVGINLYAFIIDRYQFRNVARDAWLVPPYLLTVALTTMVVGSLVWTYSQPRKVTILEP
jgi:hypothetical protein